MSEVFAFEWCDCVFESAFGVVSLHASKASAYRAMRTHLFSEATERRNDDLRYGRTMPGWKPLRHQAWRVRRIEVNP